MVVDESYNRSRDEPASLNPCQQKGVGVDELFARSQFLYKGGDRRPEHPEASCDQRVHDIELPHSYFAGEGQDRNRENDDGTNDDTGKSANFRLVMMCYPKQALDK